MQLKKLQNINNINELSAYLNLERLCIDDLKIIIDNS